MLKVNEEDIESPGHINGIYDDTFYKGIGADSLRSARIYLEYLWKYLQPESVLDVGCGTGAWLMACNELGSKELYGFDGDWNSQSKMIEPTIQFSSIDLNKPFSLKNRVDLVISLEVAEHLEPATSAQFVKCLTSASDTVLFSAAYTGQGGTNHINEKPHSYWGNLFLQEGYVPFDLFRPVFWGDERVGFWYRQNTYLYTRKTSSSYQRYKDAGITEISQIKFMDCIHPGLYKIKCGSGIGFKEHLYDLFPSLYKAIMRRINQRAV